MKEEIEMGDIVKKISLIIYGVMLVLGIIFIITCINASPNMIYPLIIFTVLSFRAINLTWNTIKSNVFAILNALLIGIVLIYGSFSDELAILLIMFAGNVYALIKGKDKRTCLRIWMVYIILCELVGILEITGNIHIKSGLYSILVRSTVVDIAFVIITIVMILVSWESSKNIAVISNAVFLAAGSIFVIVGMAYLHIGKVHYQLTEIDMLQYTEGRCVIESTLLDGRVVTGNSDNNLKMETNQNTLNQLFTFKRDERGVYTFSLETSGLFMEVEPGGVENESNVQLGEVSGDRNQEWMLIEQDNGYTIASIYNALRLDFNLMDATQGINLIVYEDNGNDSQHFRFYAPNDNEILNEYIYEVNGSSMAEFFKSVIYSILILILIVSVDWNADKILRKVRL